MRRLFEKSLERFGGFVCEADRVKGGEGGDGQILPAAKIARRNKMMQIVSVLLQERVVKIDATETARDYLADQSGQHEARHERELVSHLKNDQDCSHRRQDDRSEARTHAADDKQYDVALRQMKKLAGGPGHDCAAHSAEKEVRRKNAAAAAETIACNRGQEFAREQDKGYTPDNVTVDGIR